jgi:hypothetical protein
MTAVEWLVQELCICATEEEMNIIIQAEEMEKQQIIDCLKTLLFDISQGKDVENIELYYNETFKNTNK